MTNSLRHRIGRNQLTTLEENLMNTTEHPSRRLRSAAPRGARGLTLIELGFVIIILAVIVAVALAFYNTVSTNKKITDVVTDVASVRSAVTQYAGGNPLIGPLGRSDPTGVSPALFSREKGDFNWDELAQFLPGRLGAQAALEGGKDLANANPWKSTYTLDVVGDSPSYQWTLRITAIPSNEIRDRLREKLASAGLGLAAPAERQLTWTFDVGA